MWLSYLTGSKSLSYFFTILITAVTNENDFVIRYPRLATKIQKVNCLKISPVLKINEDLRMMA